VPQQVKTASASKWTKRAVPLAVLFGAAAAAIGTASPASADTTSYLHEVAPVYAFMSDSELLAAGNQVCATVRSGAPASDNTIKLSKQFGLSTSAAYNIVIASINHLGC
jgi:uncharacterized protein DUF732